PQRPPEGTTRAPPACWTLGPLPAASGYGFELELGLTHLEQIVVDELVLSHLLLVDHDAVGRAEINELVGAVLEANLAVVRRAKVVVDYHVAVAAGADERALRLELEGLVDDLAAGADEPPHHRLLAVGADVDGHGLGHHRLGRLRSGCRRLHHRRRRQ